MKCHKYKVGDWIVVSENCEIDVRYLKGELGHIKELHHGSIYDYIVKMDNGRELKVEEKEIELKGENNVANKDLHKQLLDEIHITYITKNADYGNSFEEQYKEYGDLSVSIRLDDKIRRFKQLTKNQAQVKTESKRDTLMDLANYAIMAVMELDKENE